VEAKLSVWSVSHWNASQKAEAKSKCQGKLCLVHKFINLLCFSPSRSLAAAAFDLLNYGCLVAIKASPQSIEN